MIPINELHNHKSFFITTSSKERFEIIPNGEAGYTIIDITPPSNDMQAVAFHSIKSIKGSIHTAMPEEIMFFDGIAKAFHFAWKKQGSEELLVSKGKIESCTVKLSIQNLEFNLQLLDMPGRKFDWMSDQKPFVVNSASESYQFDVAEDRIMFEDRKVVNILSLYKSKKIAIPELFHMENEYDAISGVIFYNHPFIVLTEDNGKLKLSFCNDLVTACRYI
ncbi:hypothetical protein M4D58_18845 [Brevibacillus borstelensis]|uniref:hypothetical protein n=1 Tax=Brevibacillus borstelensis TaxID=45462 RepID=UPI00203AA1D9|nr:hypothetical protein [Brevibacillus borstelensis]MCM3592684.1 hypothetical protein [Brevibacillus borstelensis]